MEGLKWWENPDSYDPKLVAQDDFGDYWVCSRGARRRLPESPIFSIKFRKWDPRCWPAWFRSWRRGVCTAVERFGHGEGAV